MFKEMHTLLALENLHKSASYRLHARKIWFRLVGLGLSLHVAILVGVKEAVIIESSSRHKAARFPSISINV